MKVLKEQLKFIGLYNLCSSSKNVMYSKVHIIADSEKDNVDFIMVSDNLHLITSVKTEIESDFSITLPIDYIHSLINSLGDDVEIELVDNKLKFLNAEYTLSSYDYTYDTIDYVRELITTAESFKYSIDTTGLSSLRPFTGDRGLNVIALMNNYFVSSNKFDVTACVKTTNKTDDMLFFPEMVSTIVHAMGITNLDLSYYPEEALMYFNVGSTQVISNLDEYDVSNLFDDGAIEGILYKDIVTTDKGGLIGSLKRIGIVSSNIDNNNIQFSFEEGKIIMSTWFKTDEAREIVNADVPESLYGISYNVSSKFMMGFLTIIKTQNVIFRVCDNEDEGLVLVLQDEDFKDIFIHCLYERLD